MDLPGSDWGDFSCRRAVDSSSYLSMLGFELIHVSQRAPLVIGHSTGNLSLVYWEATG